MDCVVFVKQIAFIQSRNVSHQSSYWILIAFRRRVIKIYEKYTYSFYVNILIRSPVLCTKISLYFHWGLGIHELLWEDISLWRQFNLSTYKLMNNYDDFPRIQRWI